MTKKNDFVKIDELSIIVSFIENLLTDIIKLIVCERVVQSGIGSLRTVPVLHQKSPNML